MEDIVKHEIIMLVGDNEHGQSVDELPFTQNTAFFDVQLESVINSELKRLAHIDDGNLSLSKDNESEIDHTTIDISSEAEEADTTSPFTTLHEHTLTSIDGNVQPVHTTNYWKSYNPKKRKYQLETAPAKKKRIVNRLLRNMSKIIDEYSARVGQQLVVCVMSDDNVARQRGMKVFGAEPLRQIIKDLGPRIIDTYDSLKNNTLNTSAQLYNDVDLTLFNLPELIFDGVPYTLNKLTQIVSRCYKYHGRDDLIEEKPVETAVNSQETAQDQKIIMSNLHTIKNPDGSFSIIQMDPQNPIITLPDGSIAYLETIDVDTTEKVEENVEISL